MRNSLTTAKIPGQFRDIPNRIPWYSLIFQ